ncbi:MAG: hypothetical protein M1840_000891 [Geoglossum simile]|nr:MAG: hypothetical protein M1840_000891 [Geoglossum simile]
MASTPITSNFFDSLKKSFVDVRVGDDGGISTNDFLEAAKSLTTLFDILGSVAFSPVKTDMLGNVEKIRKYQTTLGGSEQSESLQSLVGKGNKDAVEGLLWLVRGLNFTANALRLNIANDTEELSASFRKAYTGTLKPHHNIVVRTLFNVAMSATPSRLDFYDKLGGDHENVKAKMEAWLSALENLDEKSPPTFTTPKGIQEPKDVVSEGLVFIYILISLSAFLLTPAR